MSLEKKQILVLDDEVMLLDVMSELLKHLGFEFHLCSTGPEAVAAAENTPEPYAAAIIDLTLKSDEGGDYFAKLIRDVTPATKLIVSTGYEDHPAFQDPEGHGFDYRLAKPYSIDTLQKLLAEL